MCRTLRSEVMNIRLSVLHSTHRTLEIRLMRSSCYSCYLLSSKNSPHINDFGVESLVCVQNFKGEEPTLWVVMFHFVALPCLSLLSWELSQCSTYLSVLKVMRSTRCMHQFFFFSLFFPHCNRSKFSCESLQRKKKGNTCDFQCIQLFLCTYL